MEEYTMDNYKTKALQFGTLALMTTSGKDAEHVYLDYKTRGDVGQAIDAFKNIIETEFIHAGRKVARSMDIHMAACVAVVLRFEQPTEKC